MRNSVSVEYQYVWLAITYMYHLSHILRVLHVHRLYFDFDKRVFRQYYCHHWHEKDFKKFLNRGNYKVSFL